MAWNSRSARSGWATKRRNQAAAERKRQEDQVVYEQVVAKAEREGHLEYLQRLVELALTKQLKARIEQEVRQQIAAEQRGTLKLV